jgi:hypothetical protein
MASKRRESSWEDVPEPTEFDLLLELLLIPKDGTPGGQVIDLSPYLEQGFVLGIAGAGKPKNRTKRPGGHTALKPESRSGRARASSSAAKRAKKASLRSSASSLDTKDDIFEDVTSPSTQEAIFGAPDKPRK